MFQKCLNWFVLNKFFIRIEYYTKIHFQNEKEKKCSPSTEKSQFSVVSSTFLVGFWVDEAAVATDFSGFWKKKVKMKLQKFQKLILIFSEVKMKLKKFQKLKWKFFKSKCNFWKFNFKFQKFKNSKIQNFMIRLNFFQFLNSIKFNFFKITLKFVFFSN